MNGQGQEVLLKGWGLGNWLLQEGYMWKSSSPRFDRPRRIEQIIEELTGKEFASWFWKEFRDNYIRREDIAAIARLGYNSIRIPFNYRIFMEEDPQIKWKEEGFDLLDRCLDWCEAEGLYAFLDMHGAPGGQTGSNIDDSVDNQPELFMNESYRESAILLWSELARRYAARTVVGGYDLLNEPIIPPYAGNGDFDYLIPQLKQFYKDVITQIRLVDKEHLLSIEGPHWATDVRIFDELYDENMVLHFHRYAEPPEIACLKPYIKAADHLNIPLWMGETGENINIWYSALYPLAESLGIGYNLWPWKKMNCTNSPCSIKCPEAWHEILSYIEGGPHPGKQKAEGILCEYLENIRYENCIHNDAVTNHVLRRPPFKLQAVDFDCLPAEKDFDKTIDKKGYRVNSGLNIVELYPERKRRFVFDCGWERYGLLLSCGDCVQYSFDSFGIDGSIKIILEYESAQEACLEVECLGKEEDISSVKEIRKVYPEQVNKSHEIRMDFNSSGDRQKLWLKVLHGHITLKTIVFEP